jgi:hypothetical protein
VTINIVKASSFDIDILFLTAITNYPPNDGVQATSICTEFVVSRVGGFIEIVEQETIKNDQLQCGELFFR